MKHQQAIKIVGQAELLADQLEEKARRTGDRQLLIDALQLRVNAAAAEWFFGGDV